VSNLPRRCERREGAEKNNSGCDARHESAHGKDSIGAPLAHIILRTSAVTLRSPGVILRTSAVTLMTKSEESSRRTPCPERSQRGKFGGMTRKGNGKIHGR
jgi:hypothetical protein